MEMANNGYRLAVRLQEPKADYSYSDIQTYFFPIVLITPEDKIRNIGNSDWDEERKFACPYADLQFRGQGHVEKQDSVPTYGWSLEYYDLYNVDLRQAERMVKMLRKIEKIEFPVHPTSYGQYIQMACKAIGITHCVIVDSNRGSSSYDDQEYRIFPIKDAQILVDNLIHSFLEKHRVAS